MLQEHSLFDELEATLTQGPRSQRFTILRKMTDLFLAGADSYSDDHVAIFDELMGHLIEKIERQALIELSGRLAPVDRAPVNVIGRLSQDDDIEISGPILERSRVLTDRDLVAIAETKSQAHLSAIAGRASINEPVTDVLIHRGDSAVARKVTANKGARFSRFGLIKAVTRAKQDETLAVAVANRIDLPDDLLDQLVRKATEAVRQRLLANVQPEMRGRIDDVLSKVSDQIARTSVPSVTKAAGKPVVRQEPARLRARIAQCADDKNIDELVETFSTLSEVPATAIKNLVRQASDEGLMILGKACGLTWPDMQKVLSAVIPAKASNPDDGEKLYSQFTNLSASSAQRAVRFIRTNSSRVSDELRKLV